MGRERERFGNKKCRALYDLWVDAGEEAVRQHIADVSGVSVNRAVDFATFQLPHDYSVLGAVAYAF